MQDSHCDLYAAVLRSIVVSEGFARDVAAMAAQCEQDGNRAFAAPLWVISRNHLIRAMKQRDELAVFQKELVALEEKRTEASERDARAAD